MQYTTKYQSPLGEILLAADNQGLIGLWFVNQKYFADNLDLSHLEQETKVLKDAKRWLDIYFSGRVPNFQLPLHLQEQLFKMKYGNNFGNTLRQHCNISRNIRYYCKKIG